MEGDAVAPARTQVHYPLLVVTIEFSELFGENLEGVVLE